MARLLPVALALLLSGCGAGERPDIVLIVIDTLRADSLPAYGAPRENAPNLDELARGGVVFERVIAPSSWTKTSMASLMTGTDPDRHGVRGVEQTLPAELPTLARALRAAGYRTLAVQTNPWLRPRFGFDDGFDRYEFAHFAAAGKVNERALALLDDAGGEQPRFLYLHYMDVHAPYRPGRRWFDEPPLRAPGGGTLDDHDLDVRYRRRELRGPEFDRRARSLYDAELRHLDDALGALLERLREAGFLERALLVVTSDHGEAFGEHGQVTHGRTYYPEVYSVPLIFRGPGRLPAGARIAAQVRSIDIAPTLLELAGLPKPPGFQGEALLPMEPAAIRPRLARGAVGLNDQAPDRDFAGVVSEDRLYILERRSGAVEFFDLRADPGALRNLGPEHPDAPRFASLVGVETPAAVPGRTEIDGALRGELEALGYLDDAD